MTQNWLEYDQKIFTPTNLIFRTLPNFTIPTSINLTPKNMLVPQGPPALACKLALAGTPAQPRFAPLQEKNIRPGNKEDPRHKVKICWFQKVCRFQFWSSSIIKVRHCHVSVIFIRSSLFGHVNNPHSDLNDVLKKYFEKYFFLMFLVGQQTFETQKAPSNKL